MDDEAEEVIRRVQAARIASCDEVAALICAAVDVACDEMSIEASEGMRVAMSNEALRAMMQPVGLAWLYDAACDAERSAPLN